MVVYGLDAQLKKLYVNVRIDVTPPPPVRICLHFYGLNWIIQFLEVLSILFFLLMGLGFL